MKFIVLKKIRPSVKLRLWSFNWIKCGYLCEKYYWIGCLEQGYDCIGVLRNQNRIFRAWFRFLSTGTGISKSQFRFLLTGTGISKCWSSFLSTGTKIPANTGSGRILLLTLLADGVALSKCIGGGDAQNVDVDLGRFWDVECRLKGFKKCKIYTEYLKSENVN